MSLICVGSREYVKCDRCGAVYYGEPTLDAITRLGWKHTMGEQDFCPNCKDGVKVLVWTESGNVSG
jgi:hypothetical protein